MRCNRAKLAEPLSDTGEGSEESFLKREEEFLANVDAIVLEVHHWLVDPEEVRRILTRAGFTSQEVLDREHLTEILYCRRS